MKSKVSIAKNNFDAKNSLVCNIEIFDEQLINQCARITITIQVNVFDRRPINECKQLFKYDFIIEDKLTTINLPELFDEVYSYSGEKISIEIFAELKAKPKDILFFKTRIKQRINLPVPNRSKVEQDTEELISTHDEYNFSRNFKAIAMHNKIITILLILLILLMLGIVCGNIVFFIYWYDSIIQFEYDPSIIIFQLMASGYFIYVFWEIMQNRLQKYMDIQVAYLPNDLSRKTSLKIADILSGRSKLDLENVTLRIVAYNIETGLYERGTTKSHRICRITGAVQGVLLYEKTLPNLSANKSIEDYFNDEIPLEPFFNTLYPPQMISKNHGIVVVWKIQLIHPIFVDQFLYCDTSELKYAEFVN